MLSVGRKIKQRREELGMTQEDLAKKLGYTTRSTIARIESGDNNLNQKKLVDFAKALNCTAGWFLDDNSFSWSTFLGNLANNRDSFTDIEYYLGKINEELSKIKKNCFNDNFLNIIFKDRPDIIQALKTTTDNGEITIDGVKCQLNNSQIDFIRNSIIMNIEQAKKKQ